MQLHYDNKSTISIAHNLVQHDRTKHIEIDWHFIKEKLKSGLICISYVTTQGHLADILTERLSNQAFQNIVSKLGMDNIRRLEGECGKWCINNVVHSHYGSGRCIVNVENCVQLY